MGNAVSDESISKLDEVCKVLDDKTCLGKKYDENVAGLQGAEPQPAALWISEAASAEVAKLRDMMATRQFQDKEVAVKKRRVGGQAQVSQAGP